MNMPRNVRPTNKYEEIENEGRNMFESVMLQNDSSAALELWYRNDTTNVPTLHGIIQPGKALNVPKFLAEHYALKNRNWRIVHTSEPQVAEVIRDVNQQRSGAEDVFHERAREIAEDKKQTKQIRAEIAKEDAEKALEQISDDDAAIERK